MRVLCALLVAAIGLSTTVVAGQGAPQVARGVVFDDANKNGQRDDGEKGIPQVRVSNGQQIVRTDDQGRYELPIDDDTILFVIKPRGWMCPVDRLNIPRFYYIHKPAGSPKLKYPGVEPTGPLPASVDFPLHAQPEADRFSVLLLGDTQTASLEEVNFLAHDVVEQLVGTTAAFGFTLGDLVFDKLEIREPMNQTIARIGVPWRHVLGNHDEDYEAADDRHSDENYERSYGPAYYSFDYGPVHFLVLDDVMWHGKTAEKEGYYDSGLGERQMEFLRQDLTLVPREQLVVLTMHIPIFDIKERAELYRLLGDRPHTVSFSAHEHIQRHRFLGSADGWPGSEPHHHLVVGASCGCWWRGALDEVGLPHATMMDGTPNGWCLATFDGPKYTITYRAARRPAEYQMSIHAPEEVPLDQAGQTRVLVNVFAGSERSAVEMRVGEGAWARLEPAEVEDPYYAALKQAEEASPPPKSRKLPKIQKCPHLWSGTLPAELPTGTHLVEVRTKDMFGQTYTSYRIVRVVVGQ